MTTSTILQETAAGAAIEKKNEIAAPRVTRFFAGLIMLGVLLQATLAGGYLAGRVSIELHGYIGESLALVGLIVLVAGIVGRRSVREPGATLASRIGLFLAIVAAIGLGEMANHGMRDLLMLHIPVALIILGLADGLRRATRRMD